VPHQPCAILVSRSQLGPPKRLSSLRHPRYESAFATSVVLSREPLEDAPTCPPCWSPRMLELGCRSTLRARLPHALSVPLLAALSLLACGEHSLMSPLGSQLSPTSASRQAGSTFSGFIPAPPFSDGTGVPTTRTGIIIPKLSSYVLRVEGLVSLAPNSGNPCGTGDLAPESFGPGARGDELRPTVWVPGNANPI
jgi:hypothetical protein